MVQDIITDQSAPRGENCCNSNFLRSTTLKFSGNDQRTLLVRRPTPVSKKVLISSGERTLSV